MNKKILAVAILSPLLYTACNSTSNKPTKVIKTPIKEVLIEAPIQKLKKEIPTTITTNTSNETTVTFANDKSFIKDQGIMHIESFMETLQPTLMGLIKSDNSFKQPWGDVVL
jgi:hypothetical protein